MKIKNDDYLRKLWDDVGIPVCVSLVVSVYLTLLIISAALALVALKREMAVESILFLFTTLFLSCLGAIFIAWLEDE